MKFISHQLADALASWSVYGLCNTSSPREKNSLLQDKMGFFQSLVPYNSSLLRLSLLCLCLPHDTLASKY